MRQSEVYRLVTGCRSLDVPPRRRWIPSPPLTEETQALRQSQVHESQLYSPGMNPFQCVLVWLKRENSSSPVVVKLPPQALAKDRASIAGSRSSSIQNQVSTVAPDQHHTLPVMTYAQELTVRVASTSAVRTGLAITGITAALDLSLSASATL